MQKEIAVDIVSDQLFTSVYISEVIGPARELLKKDVTWNWTEKNFMIIHKIKILIHQRMSLLVAS